MTAFVASFVEPFGPLPVHPLTDFDLTSLENVLSLTMLFSIKPITLVYAPVGPVVNAISVFLIHLVLPFVPSSISPSVGALAMHIIIFPLSGVGPAIFPLILALSFDPILVPFSVVAGTILPDIEAAAVLLAFVVEAFVL